MKRGEKENYIMCFGLFVPGNEVITYIIIHHHKVIKKISLQTIP